MSFIELFKKSKVPITWTTLLLGIEGPGKFESLLDSEEIINYAIEFMDLNNNYSEEVFELASAYKHENELVEKSVRILSSKEKVAKGIEVKKWITILLIEQLKEISEEPLYGLIELTEFWERFDYPKYSPHTILGKGNDIQPKKYYTQEFFDSCVLNHKRWIAESLNKF